MNDHIRIRPIEELTPFERWMVKSNLESIKEGQKAEDIVGSLRANGYPSIAAAVEQLRPQ